MQRIPRLSCRPASRCTLHTACCTLRRGQTCIHFSSHVGFAEPMRQHGYQVAMACLMATCSVPGSRLAVLPVCQESLLGLRRYVRPIDADGPSGFRLVCESRFSCVGVDVFGFWCSFFFWATSLGAIPVAQIRRHLIFRGSRGHCGLLRTWPVDLALW